VAFRKVTAGKGMRLAHTDFKFCHSSVRQPNASVFALLCASCSHSDLGCNWSRLYSTGLHFTALSIGRWIGWVDGILHYVWSWEFTPKCDYARVSSDDGGVSWTRVFAPETTAIINRRRTRQ